MNIVHVENLDLTQLRLIEALAESGTVSGAAEQLGLSQSAASHALARLRRLLSDPVFVRTSVGMRPTPCGEKFAAAVHQALALLRSSIAENRAFDPRTSTRTVNVYLSDVGQMVFLPKLLAHLKTEAPGVTLRVWPVPSENPGAALESGEVDLAVGYFTTLSSGFFQRRLFRERYVCAVREEHPRFASGMSLQAFRSVPHAIANSSGMAHISLDRILARRKIKRDVRLYVPQFMVLPLVIANSDYLVIMPGRLAEAFTRLVKLKLMQPPTPIPSYEIKAYWHERYHHDPTNRWLRGLFALLFAD